MRDIGLEIHSLRQDIRNIADSADAIARAIDHCALWLMTLYVTLVIALAFAFAHSIKSA